MSPDNPDNDATTKQLFSLWKSYLATTNKSTAATSYSPTPIQRQLWSLLRKTSYHTIGIAPTGSGKTLSYALPTLLSNPVVVVLVPTRELVQQVARVYERLLRKMPQQQENNPRCAVVSVHGGVPRQHANGDRPALL